MRGRSGGNARRARGRARSAAQRSFRRTGARTAAKDRRRSTQRAFHGGEPAAADECGERADREPVPTECAPRCVIDCGDARLGREQRAALDRRGGDLEQHPDLARARAGEAADAPARGPGTSGRAEHDAVVSATELPEPERAHRAPDAPASGQAAQPEERAHERVRRDRNAERRRDRVARRRRHAPLVPLARVPFRHELVDAAQLPSSTGAGATAHPREKNGRNTCASGPIDTAYSTVPTPTVPPRSQPITTTLTSSDVRTTRIECPRFASPVIRPSRGPGPRPAPMYAPVATPLRNTPTTRHTIRSASSCGCERCASTTSIVPPMKITLLTVPIPGRSRSGIHSSRTNSPTRMLHVPSARLECFARPWWRTSHGLSPRPESTSSEALNPYKTSPRYS